MNGAAESDRKLLDLLKRHGLDAPQAVMAYRGGEDLVKPGLGARQRTRLELTDEAGARHVLFLKRYQGEPGFLDTVRRWWAHGGAFSPAEAEARNVEAARQAGVPTMRCAGRRSGAWGSYLFTTAVPGEALERCGEAFWRRVTGDAQAGEELAAGLAQLLRRLHEAGYVHRDFYTSHVFLDERDGRLYLYLIDLARMFRPRWRKFRWRVKDLAQLHYSLPADWKHKWWDVLLGRYLGKAAAGKVECWRKGIQSKSNWIARRAAKTQANQGARRTGRS